jgi:hypothetical protein
MVDEEPARWVHIDGLATINEIHRRVLAAVNQKFEVSQSLGQG